MYIIHVFLQHRSGSRSSHTWQYMVSQSRYMVQVSQQLWYLCSNWYCSVVGWDLDFKNTYTGTGFVCCLKTQLSAQLSTQLSAQLSTQLSTQLLAQLLAQLSAQLLTQLLTKLQNATSKRNFQHNFKTQLQNATSKRNFETQLPTIL